MAKISDISYTIPMNGTYKIRVVDRKTKQKYTISFDIVNDAVRGSPALNIGCDVKPYRKKEPKPLLGLHERKERLSVGIEKLT